MHDKPTFYELATRLDALILLQDPTENQIEEVVEFAADKALEQYFFKHLADSENVAWFEPLRQQGFFSTPPEPIEHEGTISYPRWPALWYLVAIAPELPEAVIEVAEQTSTRNPFVYLNLVRAAQRMPPPRAVRIVPLVVRWTDEGMRIGEDVISLAIHLAQGNQWEDALALVELILSPKEQEIPSRAVAKAEKYFSQWFVERNLAFFLEQRPLEILDIVEGNLIRSLEIEGRDEDSSSSGWRPAIEPGHEQNWGFGEIKDLLVDAAVQALDYIVQNMPDRGRNRVETYLRHPRSIFRRLAIHITRENATSWPDLVEDLFTDERYLDEEENRQIYHEYWMLMSEAYRSLSEAIQDSFAKRLLGKLPPDQSNHHQRYWVLRQMWAIKDSLRSDQHRNTLAELTSQYGEPDHPSFLSYSRTLVGTVSPKTSEDLINMSHEEIIAELRKELPFEGFDEPNQEGLADALKAAVVSAPGHFAPIATQLLGPDIPPVYTYHALWGFREAWKESDFDWKPVLELCDRVSQTREQESDSGEPPDMMPGYWMTKYANARSAVADLLEAGVLRDERAIPAELLPSVRDILLVLANDPNPSPEYEQRRIADGVSYGVLTIALNTVRGKAIEALIQYALHVARTGSQEQEQPTQPRSRMEDEVKGKLTEKLDKQVDSSLAVHSLFGKYLPNLHYLDEEWLASNLERIFPRRPEMAGYWEAAWDGYMFRGDFFGSLYERMLKPYYRYALEQIALGEQGRAGSEASRGRLAQHLAALYWRGIETLEDNDSLAVLFFNLAPGDLRAKFIDSLGVALREARPAADSDEWLRASTLWEARFRTIGEEIVERGVQPTGHFAELGAFVRWVPFIPENLESFYPMIRIATLASNDGAVNELIEFLASVAPNHAPFTVSLLEELLKQSHRGPWFLRAGRTAGHVRTILEAATSSGDAGAKSCTERVVNLFGTRGDERFRDLLDLG
jgi:hypothetical protein